MWVDAGRTCPSRQQLITQSDSTSSLRSLVRILHPRTNAKTKPQRDPKCALLRLCCTIGAGKRNAIDFLVLALASAAGPQEVARFSNFHHAIYGIAARA